MNYNFDELPDRRASDSLKWHFYEEDVLPMWVADMDFPSPEPVIRALQERVEHGVFGYPIGALDDPRVLGELRGLISARLARLYEWQVQPEEIIFIPGVATGFNLACHTVEVPGGAVLVETPLYPPILLAPGNAGLACQDAEMRRRQDGSYEVDWDTYATAMDERTRLFILCNPHNPVGRVFRKEELERMALLCLQRGVIICSDEIHCDLLFKGQRHIPIASLDAEIAHNTITLMAPTKTFNLAGLHMSFAIIQNPELRKSYLKNRQGLVSWVNLLGQVAMLAAYRDGQEWCEQLLVYLESNRDILYDYVQQELPGIEMAKPEGTYLAWLDCRESRITGNPCEFFLKKGRVALMDGAAFGKGGEGFVRLNFGCPQSMLLEGLERMKNALGKIAG